MLYVVEDYVTINNPDIDYIYGDFHHKVIIIDVKNENGNNYLSDHYIRRYDIEDMYDVDDLNEIISNLEECIECTTDEDDIRSDMYSIILIRNYIPIWGNKYR